MSHDTSHHLHHHHRDGDCPCDTGRRAEHDCPGDHDRSEARVGDCCQSHDAVERRAEPHRFEPVHHAALSGEPGKAVLYIENMDCPTEERLIRSKLSGMPEVSDLQFNLLQRRLTISHSVGQLPSILAALRSVGFEATVEGEASRPGPRSAAARWTPLVLAVMCAAAAEGFHWHFGENHWLVLLLSLLAIGIGGLSTYRKGLVALRNFDLNINALMSLAVTGALLIGHWPEAAMVMSLFALAEVIEARSLERARHAIESLMAYAPETATVWREAKWTTVPAKEVRVDERMRIRPGERVGLDAMVIKGRSTVDQSPITGESLPIEKEEGATLYAGSLNQAGALECQVLREAESSTLARIIHAVENAQSRRAPSQRFVDAFARIYTPVVFGLALLVAILPPLVYGDGWLDWIYKALILLVIACPCALVISTPITIVSGLAAAARKGILIKGGVYLEKGRRLAVLALDKTGTLTQGMPVVTDRAIATSDKPCARDHDLHIEAIAASLAHHSSHPVSLAVVAGAESAGLTLHAVDNFQELAGRGVSGEIEGSSYYLGNHRLVEDLGLCSPTLEAQFESFEKQGKTVVALACDSGVHGLFAVGDTIRDASRRAVSMLHKAGVRTLMLTGDNQHTALAIARDAGIDDVRGELLPEDKLTVIDQLAASSPDQVIGMVGDGINDAPALARATLGFAMAKAGSDVAIETADIVLMSDDLRKIPTFLRLSQATYRILVQNIALALGIKVIFLALTLTGEATMWMAVFADMGASMLVVGNALRLLQFKDKLA